MRDMKSTIDVVKSLEAAAFTTTANGAGVDLQGYEGALFMYDMGVFAGTTPTATLKLQESDDNVAFTDVAAGDLEGVQPVAISDTADQVIARVGYKGSKRYLRLAITAMAGTGPSLPLSGSIARSKARHNPLT